MQTIVARKLASGLLFGEGIRWNGHAVVLSDMLGKRVVEVNPDSGGVTTVLEVDNQPNGLIARADGSLLINSMFDCRLLCLSNGQVDEYCDLSQLATGYLGDIVDDRDGGYYVDDVGARVLHGEKPAPGRLLYVNAAREVSVARDQLAFANGVVISPDGARLYLAETMISTIKRYDIQGPGVLGEGQAFAGMYLAINPGHIKVPLAGTATVDPAFGLNATWVDARTREQAQAAGYTVVDAATVIATHLNHVMQSNAAALLGRVEVQDLLDHTRKYAPALVDDTVPKLIALQLLQKVLRNLLDESIHIRDLRGILELLAEHAGTTQDSNELTRELRIGLSAAIVQDLYGPVRELGVMAVEPGLEQVLVQALSPDSPAPLDPGMGDLLSTQAADAARQQEEAGLPACLLVPDRIRAPLSRLLKRKAPRLRVLAHSEIPRTHSIHINRVIGVTS